MIKENELLQTYENALVENDNDWNAHLDYIRKDACHIMYVRGALHTKKIKTQL